MQIKTKKLKLLFDLIYTQISEITIRSTESGWAVKAVDPSHTSMIAATLPATAFVGYQQSNDFALDLKNVTKALGNAGEETEITINDGTFVLESEGLRSKFPQIAVSETDPKIPNVEYAASVTLPIGEITRISKAVYGSVDTYTFTIGNGALVVSALDESKNGSDLIITKDKCLDIKGEAKSTFAIDLLDRLLKIMPADTVVDLSLGNDYPLQITMSDNELEASYLLAPRIVNDGE